MMAISKLDGEYSGRVRLRTASCSMPSQAGSLICYEVLLFRSSVVLQLFNPVRS